MSSIGGGRLKVSIGKKVTTGDLVGVIFGRRCRLVDNLMIMMRFGNIDLYLFSCFNSILCKMLDL